VEFAGGLFQIGNIEVEYQAIIAAEGQRDAELWYQRTLNMHVVTVGSFALVRYPVTNAQWAIFMAQDGYNPKQPWWDAAGRA
jgi:formylglycine-generating enzyme required for sulfatase activity